MPKYARLVLLALAVLLATACGGGGASSDDNPPLSDDQIEISGDETNLIISDPGGCGPHAFEPGAWNAMFTTDGDEPWLLDVTIVTFEAPKVYETSAQDASGMASIFLTNGAGTTYESGDGMGTFTVEGGGLSGSLDLTLSNADDGSTVSVRGGFSCEDLS
jgi:hypothetical protein